MRNQWSWLLAGAVAVLAAVMPANAAVVTNCTAAGDGDGAVVCTYGPTDWTVTDEGADMNVYGDQYWGPAHIDGKISVDGEDPTVHIYNVIDNDSALTWTAYQVNVYLNKTFTMSAVAVTTPGWSLDSVLPVVTGPVLDSDGTSWGYKGTFNLVGTPIAPGGNISFDYKITFVGSVLYSQEMIPAPEPATVGVLLLGGLTVLIRRRRNR